MLIGSDHGGPILAGCVHKILEVMDLPVEVHSYKEDFNELWSPAFSPKGTLIVVFDAVPDATTEQNGLNLADRLTAYDWIAWLALREQDGFSIMLLDLAGHRHPGSFGVDALPMLLPDLPWVRLYRLSGKPAKGAPALPDEGAIVKLLAQAGDVGGRLAAKLGRDGFSECQLFYDLKPREGHPSIPLPARKAPPRTGNSSDPVSDRIRNLWTQSLTRAHGRHEVANLVGPLVLASAMVSINDRGASEFWKSEIESDNLTGAFCRLLRALHLLPPGLLPKSPRPELPPLSENAEYFPPAENDPFSRFKENVRFLLVDDQARLGYAQLLAVLLTGETGPPFPPGAKNWEHQHERVSLHAAADPEILIGLLKAAAESDWNKLKLFGDGQFDVLLLDLRLFPASNREGAWGEEARFLQGLIEQASENQAKAQAILGLHARMLGQVAELTHSQHAARTVEFLFGRPVFASSHFVDHAAIPRPTALRFLAVLRDGGILRTIREGAGRRAAIYAFSELLNIAEGRPLL